MVLPLNRAFLFKQVLWKLQNLKVSLFSLETFHLHRGFFQNHWANFNQTLLKAFLAKVKFL